MRVLIACERSGAVRDAFRRLGHDAWSCDTESSETGCYHFQRDVLEILGQGWDLMIAHPPCTYLASSGLHWNKRVLGRDQKTKEALDFVLALLNADIEKIALENPIGRIGTAYRKADQIIQPYMFGHPEAKATCLWLKNLPKLYPTNLLLPKNGDWKRGWDNQTPSGQNKLGPSPTRAFERARTYEGVAEAMAQQWGKQ